MKLLNPFDVGIVVILLFFLMRGLFRGFIREVFSIIGVVGGFYLGCAYYSEGAAYLTRWISSVPYPNVVSFLAIFIGVIVLANLSGLATKHLLNIIFLRWVDRFFGALFGAAKGIMIASMLLMASAAFFPEFGVLIKTSRLVRPVMRVSETIASLVPVQMKREFQGKLS